MKTTLAPFHRVFKDKTSGNKKFLSSEYLTHGKLAIVDQGQSTVAGFTDEIDASCKIMLPCVIFGDHTKKFQFQEKPFALGADGVKALEIARDVDPKYAYYAISLFRFPDGTGYSRHFKFLKEAKISLPDDIAEQRRIAAILDKVDAIRRKRQQSLKLADDLVKSQFIEMFGDPVTNPMGWEVKSVDHLCDAIYGGGTPSKSRPEYFMGTIPWVSPKDMKSLIIDDSIDHITNEAIQNSSTKLVPKGSVLMVIRSGILKRSLPVAINAVPVAINQDMKAFIPNELVISSYLLHCFKLMEPDILSGVRAVTADNIDFTQFRERLIPRPPLPLQNEFSAFVEQVDKSKFVTLAALRSAILYYKGFIYSAE